MCFISGIVSLRVLSLGGSSELTTLRCTLPFFGAICLPFASFVILGGSFLPSVTFSGGFCFCATSSFPPLSEDWPEEEQAASVTTTVSAANNSTRFLKRISSPLAVSTRRRAQRAYRSKITRPQQLDQISVTSLTARDL